MLKITAVTDTTGRYLLDDPASEIADLFDGTRPGQWSGRSAGRHGLNGDVRENELSLILDGRVPGGTLQPSARRLRTAHDLVFAAPKPVSVLMATPDESVARATVLAHEAAVGAALGYVEDRGAGIVRATPGGGRAWLHVEGLVAARFTHGTSRSGDPHLHSHVVVANRARAADGRFGPLDALALRAHGRAADAVYLAALRSELTARLSVTFLRAHDGTLRIEGISDATCLALSGRSEEVRRGAADRPMKISRSRAEVLELWSARTMRVVSIEDQPRFHRSPHHLDEHRAAALLHDRPLIARHVVESVASAATSGISVDAIGELLARTRAPLGRGIGETALPSSVVPHPKALETLGPRPTARDPLGAWLDEAEHLRSRSRSDRSVIVRDR